MIVCSTKVVHCKKEPYDVYIGRAVSGLKGSIWANPYKIGPDGDRDEVIAKYRSYILSNPQLLAQLESLRGKTLGCWCSPQKCHGDVLVELLDQQQTSLGPCIKCGGPAVLKSPSGNPKSIYCKHCGHCGRKEYDVVKGYLVLRYECKKTIEEFVLHPRMGIWCCPCVGF